MPLDAIFSAADHDYSRFTGGATLRLPDSGVELARTNAILSQWLRDLEADGAPVGMTRPHIPVDEGYDVFIGTTRANMAKYNLHPILPEDDAFQFNRPIVAGGAPRRRNAPDTATLAVDPDPPTLAKVDLGDVGYPVGTYLAAKTIVGRSGKTHTRLSPPVEVTVSTNGQDLEWQAATDLPEEAYGEGLWLSKPVTSGSPDPSTMRLQAVKKKGPRTYTTHGPLKLGTYARKPPTRNETKVGKPKPLRRPQDYHLQGGFDRDLQPMRARFAISVTTPLGESEMAEFTDVISIDREQKHHAWIFHPKNLHPDATGYKIYAMVDATANPPIYQLIRTPKSEETRRFALDTKPHLNGYIDSGEGSSAIPVVPSSPDQDSPDKKKKRDKKPHRFFYILGSADTFSGEDTTGIEDPTGDIDPPVPVGLGQPPAGTYYVSYCRRFDGKQTQASSPVKMTLPDVGAGSTNKVIELRFPPRVNKLFNALYGQLNQKGIPSGWAFYKQDGTRYTTTDAQISVSAGKVRLSTSGAPSLNDRYPQAVSYDPNDVLNTLTPANRDRLERLRGTLEVTGYVSGRAYIELAQFDDTGTEIAGSAVTLGTLTQSGYLYINTTIADASLSPGVALNASAAYLAVRWGLENGTSANRNARVAAYSLYHHPFDGEPRVFGERSAPDDYWIPSLDPAAPIPSSHVLAIGPPPPVPGDIAGITPLDTIDHTTGSVVVGTGALPANWAVTRTAANANNEATIAATTGFDGTSQNAAKFRSDDLNNANNNYFQRDYTGVYTGTSMAVLDKIYIERLPSKAGSNVKVSAIRTATGEMARVYLWAGGYLALTSVSSTGNERTVTLASGLRVGDVIEYEVLVGGGGTSNGNVTTSVGVNGAVRSAGPSLESISYTGMNPRVVRYGAFGESRSDIRWTIWHDDVKVTRSGYTASLPAPASGVTPTTDRPQYASSAWVASTPYSRNQVVTPTTANGHYYRALGGGTSAATQPVWPTDPFATVTDGGVTWQELSSRARASAPDKGDIEQGYAFFLPSDVLNTEMGHVVDEYFVFPGVQRTAALFMKPQNFPAGVRAFVLAAYNASGERVELGCLSEQTGANRVANAAAGWYEYWMAYTPPAGYFRLRWEHQGTTGGSYVYQEPLDALGNLTTEALRDAARVEARASTGTFSALLEARVPSTEGTNMENGWREKREALNVVSTVPDALANLNPAAVTYRARGTDLNPPTAFSGWQSDPNLLADYRWLEVEVTLRGDGISTPVIPSGGVNVIYSTYQPILLRDDRTALPGGVLVGGDSATNLPRSVNRHDYDNEPVNGNALPRALTDRKRRMGSYAIRVYHPDAEDEVADNMLATDRNGIVVLTDWFIEDWYENLVQRVRFYGASDFAPEADYPLLERRWQRRVPRVMTIEQTQVLEAGPLS